LRQIEVTPSATLTDKIKSKQDLARDWAKRVVDPATNFSVEEIEPQLDPLHSVNNQLGHLIEISDQIINAQNSWPQSLQSPAYLRYVSFLRERVDRAINAVVAGTETNVENDRFWQIANLHRLLLDAIESLAVAPTNWPSLPPKSPVMEAYQQHLTQLRDALEQALSTGARLDNRTLEQDEQILHLMRNRVDMTHQHDVFLGEIDLPKDALPVIAYNEACANYDATLQALIAHRRTPVTDEATWHLSFDKLNQQLEQHERIIRVTREWSELTRELIQNRKRCQQLIAEAPPAMREEINKNMGQLQQAHNNTDATMKKALSTSSRLEAVQAKGELTLIMRQYQFSADDLEFHQQLREQEQGLHDQATKATKALAELTSARDALIAARTQQRTLELAAARANQAREVAEIMAEQAEQAADNARNVVERQRETLNQRIEAAHDAAENPAPEPEAKPNF
jgi:hypothetical protein